MISDGEEQKNGDVLSALLSSCNGNDQQDTSITNDLITNLRRALSSVNSRKRVHEEINNDKIMANLLKTIESLPSDLILDVLLTALESYIVHTNARSKRLRKLSRLDATSCLIRSLRQTLKSSPASSMIGRIIDVLLIVAVKDRKLPLKLRMGGVLPLAVQSITNHPSMSRETQFSLFRLLCRAARSPRNAQLISRQKDTLSQIIKLLSEYHEEDLNRSFPASESLLYGMARLLELTFLISKNKKARTQLAHEAVRQLHRIWSHNLREKVNSISESREEVCLVATGVLRLLVKNKKAKEEMIELDTVRICEEIVSKDPKNEASTNQLKDPQINTQLQESLCGLCLRCMPSQPFPLPSTSNFPYSLTLPSERRRSISRTIGVETGVRRPSTSKSRVLNDGDTVDLGSSEEEDVGEEDGFLSLLESRDLRNIKGKEDQSFTPTDDEEETTTEKDKPQLFFRQELDELRDNYESAFCEFEDGVGGGERDRSSPPPNHDQAIRAETMTTRSVIRFTKIAYPDLCGPDVDLEMQALKISTNGIRTILSSQLSRSRVRNEWERRIVYSLDEISDIQSNSQTPLQSLGNDDQQRIGRGNPSIEHLLFESRFEGGNLRMATLVGPNHYELILSPDINQTRDHFQWFYFEISNNRANVPYTFEIINCLKPTSMFGHGMQPVMFSVSEALEGRPGWVRAGQQIHYYRNLYTMSTENDENSKRKTGNGGGGSLYTTRFTVSFRHKADVIYIAYHFPYTYSFMKTIVHRHLLSSNQSGLWMRGDVIGDSLGGNPIHCLTFTAPGNRETIRQREIIVLMSRVHPGESNASWMMHGILGALTANNSPGVRELLSKFVIKVIPMLNPDGVINGSHRCSLAGVDLNRVWDRPSKIRHPEIYHSKALIQYMVDILDRRPFCVIDLHGHSRKMNVFMYGNNPAESWRLSDRQPSTNRGAQDDKTHFDVLPEILAKMAPGFSLKCCRYSITKAKEPSARIALWRQFSLPRVYTMESTYCGFDSGKYHGYQMGVFELKEMGAKLVASLNALLRKADYISKNPDEGTRREVRDGSHQGRKSRGEGTGRSRSRSAHQKARQAKTSPKPPHKSILDP